MKDLVVFSVMAVMTAALLTGVVALNATMLMVVTNWWAGTTVVGFWDCAVAVVVCQILFGRWNRKED
jgi:hypothetical protein